MKTGKPIPVSVRVPSKSLFYNLAQGLDAGIDSIELYESNNQAVLTHQHVHGLIKSSLFGYNEKQSFGRVDFDLTAKDPTFKYTVVNIDGKAVHSLELKRSELQFK